MQMNHNGCDDLTQWAIALLFHTVIYEELMSLSFSNFKQKLHWIDDSRWYSCSSKFSLERTWWYVTKCLFTWATLLHSLLLVMKLRGPFSEFFIEHEKDSNFGPPQARVPLQVPHKTWEIAYKVLRWPKWVCFKVLATSKADKYEGPDKFTWKQFFFSSTVWDTKLRAREWPVLEYACLHTSSSPPSGLSSYKHISFP